MSESTTSARTEDMSTPARDCPEGGLGDSVGGSPGGPIGQAGPSVRELLAELAKLEDATRGLGGVRRPVWTVQTPDLLAALAREQEIIDELHRRCPNADPATASTADEDKAAGQPD